MCTVRSVLLVCCFTSCALSATYIESFSGGKTDPFFNHSLKSISTSLNPGSWQLANGQLWLFGAQDDVTFNVQSNETVAYASVTAEDWQSVWKGSHNTVIEFVGTQRTVTKKIVLGDGRTTIDTSGLVLGDLQRISISSAEGTLYRIEVHTSCERRPDTADWGWWFEPKAFKERAIADSREWLEELREPCDGGNCIVLRYHRPEWGGDHSEVIAKCWFAGGENIWFFGAPDYDANCVPDHFNYVSWRNWDAWYDDCPPKDATRPSYLDCIAYYYHVGSDDLTIYHEFYDYPEGCSLPIHFINGSCEPPAECPRDGKLPELLYKGPAAGARAFFSEATSSVTGCANSGATGVSATALFHDAGDLNWDGVIDEVDLQIARDASGLFLGAPGYDRRVDIDLDGFISDVDWQLIYGPVNPPPATQTGLLQCGFPISNLSGSAGSEQVYRLEVPAGVSTLQIKIFGGTGDADLYVKRGSAPTTTSYDYRPYLIGSNETVTVDNPAAGSWFVMIRSYAAFSGLTLQASCR